MDIKIQKLVEYNNPKIVNDYVFFFFLSLKQYSFSHNKILQLKIQCICNVFFSNKSSIKHTPTCMYGIHRTIIMQHIYTLLTKFKYHIDLVGVVCK